MKDTKKYDAMKMGGKILSDVIAEILVVVKPGVTELEIDALAEKLIRAKGGEPGFMKVPGYKNTICASTNDVVVHGIPTDRVLKDGDVIGVDCGVFYQGYHTDMAQTVLVKSSNLKVKSLEEKNIETFLKTGYEAMWAGIGKAQAGNHVGHISKAIQDTIEKAGYSVVRNLVGHGIGRTLHEAPEIPGYLSKSIEKTPLLKEGMTIAIEAIYNMGGKDVAYKGPDGWTISTSDGTLSGMFERTVVITKGEAELITPDIVRFKT